MTSSTRSFMTTRVWTTTNKMYSIEYEKNDWYGDVKETNDFVSYAGIETFMNKITRSEIKPRVYQIEYCSCGKIGRAHV